MDGRTPTDAEIGARSATGIEVERGVAAALRQVLASAWWSVRAHVADVHLLPRREALEPPPAHWLKGWASEPPPHRPQGGEALSEPSHVGQASLFTICGGNTTPRADTGDTAKV